MRVRVRSATTSNWVCYPKNGRNSHLVTHQGLFPGFHSPAVRRIETSFVMHCRSLKVLNLGTIPLALNEVTIICDNCVELKEFAVNLGTSEAVSYFCENLTPKIRKLNIFFSHTQVSEQAEKLTKRCNKLIALSIIGKNTVTINGISNIIKHLSQTLKKIRFGLRTNHDWYDEQGNLLMGIVNKTARR